MNQLFAACPRCGTPDPEPVKFTWWGGAVGPRMFHHVRCRSCRNEYNGRTGLPNTGAIIGYQVVAFALMVGVYLLLVKAGLFPPAW